MLMVTNDQMLWNIGHNSLVILQKMLCESVYYEVNVYSSLASLRWIYRDEDLEPVEPVLKPGEKLHVPVYHDESTCHSNELRCRVWVQNGKMPLRKKGEGRAIHISDFIVEQAGRIALNEEQQQFNAQLPTDQRLTTTDAPEVIYLGKNSDGWWNMERLIAQVCS